MYGAFFLTYTYSLFHSQSIRHSGCHSPINNSGFLQTVDQSSSKRLKTSRTRSYTALHALPVLCGSADIDITPPLEGGGGDEMQGFGLLSTPSL